MVGEFHTLVTTVWSFMMNVSSLFHAYPTLLLLTTMVVGFPYYVVSFH